MTEGMLLMLVAKLSSLERCGGGDRSSERFVEMVKGLRRVCLLDKGVRDRKDGARKGSTGASRHRRSPSPILLISIA